MGKGTVLFSFGHCKNMCVCEGCVQGCHRLSGLNNERLLLTGLEEVQGQGASTVPLPGLPPCCILTWQRENSGLLLFLFTSKALIPSWGPTLMTYFKHN